jgi:uncharacterized protein
VDYDTPTLTRERFSFIVWRLNMTDPAATAAPDAPQKRIVVIDVLRGFALLGMILVHFHSYANTFHDLPGHARTSIESAIGWGVWLLVETKSYATFSFLFGVGFAIQLRKAESPGVRFVAFYLRRLLVLAVIGLCAHAMFGFAVLFGYAYRGLWMLPMRKWSTRALLAAALVSAIFLGSYETGLRVRDWATMDRERAVAASEARDKEYVERARAVRANLNAAEEQSSYVVTVRARLRDMAWHYTQRWFLLPSSILTLFLLGMVALRCRIFEEPRRWIRVITGFMVFGVIAWASARWLLPFWEGTSTSAWLLEAVRYGLGLANEQWLAFTYIGGLLLLVAYRPHVLQRLESFAWVGRMALTNYLFQIVALDLLFAGYALNLDIREVMVIPATLLLFGVEIVLSRYWLGRFRFGPVEWLWRSLSYGRRQPLAIVDQRSGAERVGV